MALDNHAYSNEEGNQGYFSYKHVSRICGIIDRIGAKQSRKISPQQMERATRVLLELARSGRDGISLELQDRLKKFIHDLHLIQRDLFPEAIPLEGEEEGRLTPKQINGMLTSFKNVFHSKIPGIADFTTGMLCDLLTRVDPEALAWIMTSIWTEKIEQEYVHGLTKDEHIVFKVFALRQMLARIKPLIARIENDPELTPTLSVHANVRKFSENLQTLEMTLQDIAFVTFNPRSRVTGALTLTDELATEELFKDFVEVSANKSNPADQQVYILFLSSEHEEHVRKFYSQQIADTIYELDWAHETQDGIRFWVTEFFIDYMRTLGYKEEHISAYHIYKEYFGTEEYAAVTVDPQSGLYVDIVYPRRAEPRNVLEIDL